MNRREKLAAASMVAEWEWQGGGSSSEAAARYSCAREAIETLKLPDEDVLFARVWEIARQAGITGDESLLDALEDMVEQHGYDAVVEIVEKSGFDGLTATLLREKGR